MNKNEFWELIQSSFQEGEWETDKQMEILIDKLSNYSEEEIFKFQYIYDVYSNESYKSKLWAAAYVMNGGCSDDCFDYFRGWLISRGEEAYLNALKDPDSIIELDIAPDCDYFENEQMLYVPGLAFNKSFGTDDIDLYYTKLDQNKLDPSETFQIVDTIVFGEDIDVDWDEDDEKNLKSLVPKLYDKYW
ncbi:MAG: DUF4240 domain-containing protein [Methanobacteriaceae archaeon]|jgi:hypothetical protein|nr:DUF4240 domain-containing protein [Candidatus Methanorudis spinitermitis]